MSYASVSDMVIRFGEAELLRLAITPAGELDSAAIALALSDASALIDGYLAGRYPLPLAHVPSALVPICADIAATASMASKRRSRSPSAMRRPWLSSSQWARGSWRWGSRLTVSNWRARTWPNCSPMVGCLVGAVEASYERANA